MSKDNNSMDNFADYEALFDLFSRYLGDASRDIRVFSDTLNSSMKDVLEREVAVKNSSKLTSSEIEKIVSKVSETLKRFDMELGTEGKSILKHFKEIAKVKAQSESGLSFEKMMKEAINVAVTEIIRKANNANRAGKDSDAFIKNFSDSKMAKVFSKEIDTSLGKNTDSINYKMQTFFGERFKAAKKTLFAFGADLIEGLSKNKFIGGALADTIKLIGLLGANWLHKHFGELGDKIGAGFVAITQVLASLLPALLLTGITNFFTGGRFLRGIGNVFKLGFSFFKNLFKGGAALPKMGSMFEGIKNVFTKTPKQMKLDLGSVTQGTGRFAKIGATLGKAGSTVGRAAMTAGKATFGLPAMLAGLAATPLANFAVKKGVNASLAHGASGAIQGALIGSIFGPVGTGIGAAIGGIAGIVKGFREDSKEHNKVMEDDAKEQKSWWQSFWDWLKGSPLGELIKKGVDKVGELFNGEGSSGANSLGQNISRKDSKDNIAGATTVGNLKVAKDGAILNLSDLSQVEASKQLQAYEKADPTSFGKVYEWADSSVARLGSFKTDAAKLNNKNQATAALMYKGATNDMLALRKQVEAEFINRGYDPVRAHKLAENLAYTSGRMTGSNTQHKGKGKWKSHDNIYGFGFDIGGGDSWSNQEYNAVSGVVKDFYRAKGLQVAFEGEGQGNSTGKHWDIKPVKDMRAKGAQEILDSKKEGQNVLSERHSIDAASILMKEASKEEVERINREANKNKIYSQDELTKMYEARLNEMGFYHRQMEGADGSKGVWVKTTDNGDKILNAADYPGNSTFNDGLMRNLAVISNQGV